MATEENFPWSLPYDDGSTGVESEDTTSGITITEPFDPTQIRVTSHSITVDLLLKRISQEALILSPGFQRKGGIWTDEAQSRLIESLLIRIPIPAFYIDETDEEHWLVVDGLQRLTTLKRFVILGELKLRGLEFLTEYNGYTYENLPLKFKRRILETEVYTYRIQRGTPDNVKFNIFKRINTGGLPLSAQEIRHALNQGQATRFLERLANSSLFLKATARSISDKRMADRECVLRFAAFSLTPYTQYKVPDFDGFLNETMRRMNNSPETQLAELEKQFRKAMDAAYRLFGADAFRKRFNPGHSRYAISKALFETWSVNLAALDETEIAALEQEKEKLIFKFMQLMGTREFNDAVSQGTGDIKKVGIRFSEIERIIQEVLTHDADRTYLLKAHGLQ